MRKVVLVVFTLILTLFIAACSSEGEKKEVSEDKNLAPEELLDLAIENLQGSETYIEAHFLTERIDDSYIHTEVTFKNPQKKDKEGNYSPSMLNKTLISFPYAVKTKGDMIENTPVRILDTVEGKRIEYIIPNEQSEPEKLSESEDLPEEVTLNIEEVNAMLEIVSKNEELGDFGIFTYTGADFNIKSVKNRLKGLKEKETTVLDGKEFVVLEAEIKGDKDEWFFKFEESNVEFWIEKDTKLLVKEVYRDKKNYEEDTGAEEHIYYYTYDTSFELYETSNILEKYHELLKLLPINEDVTEVMLKTKSDYTGVDYSTESEELEEEITEEEN